jgi:peroxiredoxin
MKKLFFVLSLAIFKLTVFAQAQPQQPVFKVGAAIPKINLRNMVDSTPFTNAHLEKNKKTIFIYFGPDCGHCINFTKKLTDSIDLLKNTKIVMVSSSPFSQIRKFYEEHKIADFPAISMARDAEYFFITYYNVRQFPAALIYNAKGKYVKGFENEFSISEMAAVH